MCVVSTDLNLFWERPLLHRSQKSPRQFFYPPVRVLSNWQVLYAQVMAYQPSKPENFGLENHCKGIVTPTGLSCLTHNSLWYLKRRPLIDHNLFIFVFQRSAPSKERSRCVHKMKPPVWTIDTCTGAKGKRPVPTHLILTSSKSPRAQTAGFPCAQELHKSNQGKKKKRPEEQVLQSQALDTPVWKCGPTPDMGMEIIQLASTVRKAAESGAHRSAEGEGLWIAQTLILYLSGWGMIRHFQQASVCNLCCSTGHTHSRKESLGFGNCAFKQ